MSSLKHIWYGNLNAWSARVYLFSGGLLSKGDTLSAILVTLAGGTSVLFVLLHARMVVWRFAG